MIITTSVTSVSNYYKLGSFAPVSFLLPTCYHASTYGWRSTLLWTCCHLFAFTGADPPLFEKASNVPLRPSLILTALGLHYPGVRTNSLTVNLTDRHSIISYGRIHIELLASFRDMYYLTLPTWIRLPDHSYLLKSPASVPPEYDFTWLNPFSRISARHWIQED